MKKKKNLFVLLIIVTILGILGFTFKKQIKNLLFPIYKTENRVSKKERFQEKHKNEEVQGWIKIQGTNIDYPIVLNDGLDYQDLKREFDYGWVNARLSSKQNFIPIYGHNIRNVSKQPIIGDSSMARFEQVMSYIYYHFNEENKYIQLTIGDKNYLYQIFAVSMNEKRNAKYYPGKLKKEKLQEYIDDAIENSYFKYNIKVDSNDKIISIVTCTRFDGNASKNFKIDARLVKKQNVGYNYNVEKTKKYKEIEKILKGDGENV